MGTLIASGAARHLLSGKLWSGRWVVAFPRGRGFGPDWEIIRELFRFGLPAGFRASPMNVGGVILLGFIGSLAQSAEAQAAFAISYTQLFSLITWTSVGLMGAAAAVAGQNLGAGRPIGPSKRCTSLPGWSCGGHAGWPHLPSSFPRVCWNLRDESARRS